MKEEFKRVKTFMKAMDWFNLSMDEKIVFLDDKRLTQSEKIILECSTLIRKSKFDEIIQALVGLKTQNMLVESQRCLVLGVTYNAACQSDKAIPLFKRSIEILELCDMPTYEFNAQLQLFFTYLNLKKHNELPAIIDRMHEIMGNNERDKISYFRCRFNYHTVIGDFKTARSLLSGLDKMKSKMHPSQHIVHLIDKFIFYLKVDEFTNCEKTLDELKGHRQYRLSENYEFMVAMLDHYQHRKPIYLYDKDYVQLPMLYYQLKVIQMLESGNHHEASYFWSKLNGLNPQVYAEFMNYQGDKSLFSLCLSLYQSKNVYEPIKGLLPREEIFIKELMTSPTPVMKEELYQAIWGKPLESKEDLAKFTMMVSRVKKKTGLEIKSRKGSYYIEVASDEKKRA